jgi:hypothetical protein
VQLFFFLSQRWFYKIKILSFMLYTDILILLYPSSSSTTFLFMEEFPVIASDNRESLIVII